MKKFIIVLSVGFLTFNSSAQTRKKNIRYEYKKYEKFDFGEIGVSGESGSPGDLSISPTLRKEFQNKLPERKNFNKEMRRSINGIR